MSHHNVKTAVVCYAFGMYMYGDQPSSRLRNGFQLYTSVTVKDEFLEFAEAASSTEGGSSFHFISSCRTLLTGWKPCVMVLSPLRGNVVH